MGVGAVKRLSSINFGIVKDMMLTWVFTFPGCGLISYVMAKLFMALFKAFEMITDKESNYVEETRFILF